jgi:hypothetical protein
MNERLAILKSFLIAFVIVLTTLPGYSQSVIDGVVLDSNFKPVGGVDVSLFIAGRKAPVESQKSDSKTGKYRFQTSLSEAFDIVFLHSQYQMASVSRLAENDNQHISKVIYLKGEPVPSTAADDQLHSAQRLIFLAASLRLPDRASFLDQFNRYEIWMDPNKLKLANEVPTAVRLLWKNESLSLEQVRIALLKSE